MNSAEKKTFEALELRLSQLTERFNHMTITISNVLQQVQDLLAKVNKETDERKALLIAFDGIKTNLVDVQNQLATAIAQLPLGADSTDLQNISSTLSTIAESVDANTIAEAAAAGATTTIPTSSGTSSSTGTSNTDSSSGTSTTSTADAASGDTGTADDTNAKAAADATT